MISPTTPEHEQFLQRQAARLQKGIAAEAKLRGSGRTTKQLQALPIGGLYVSCNNSSVYYDKRLARFLNRGDILVVGPEWVVNQRWQGMEYTAIEVDHAYLPRNKNNELFYVYLHHAKTRVRK